MKIEVAPLVGAWVETTQNLYRQAPWQSRPSWARGLKLNVDFAITVLRQGRAPRGRVG